MIANTSNKADSDRDRDSNPLNARLVPRSAKGGEEIGASYEPLEAGTASIDAAVDTDTPGQYLPTGLFLASYAVNLCTLGLFGLHWAYLACNGPTASRRDSFLHFLSYLLAAGLTSLGAWCRTASLSGVVDCPNGEEMSVQCLYHTQPTKYALVYTIHYFGLAWLAVRLVSDMLHIPCWCVDIYQRKNLSMYYSGWRAGGDRVAIGGASTGSTSSASSMNGKENANANSDAGGEDGTTSSAWGQCILKNLQLSNYTYFHWLFLVWLMATLTWTLFVNWSTGDANGVQGLATAEFLQMFGYFALTCVYYYVQ
jgi:hypothetical protein